MSDMVNQPPHYKQHPSGVECIEIVEHLNFCLGSAVKYIWRAGLKSDDAIEDLAKAEYYIKREIDRLRETSFEFLLMNPHETEPDITLKPHEKK